MANSKFDHKSFNGEAFKYAVERIPNLKMNEIKKSRAVVGNADIKSVFSNQDGTAYARIAMRGLLDGDAVNYDGATNITATSTKTFEQGIVVVGRAKAWKEKDFSYDITGGIDFMDNVAAQVAEYWDGIDEDTILAILEGIFSMTGTKNLEFVNGHTYDISGTGDGLFSATTINSAANKACGANKKKFTIAFVHPDVATAVENLNLLKHLTYTDKDGITRDLDLGTVNGKLFVITDRIPTADVAATYAKTSDVAINNSKTYYTKSGDDYTAVAEPDVSDIGDYYEETAAAYVKYTTYLLGDGSFSYENIGAKVPYEMDRDPATNGGEDYLYSRQRKVFAPFGISYEKASQSSLSPTDTELKNGANWTLVHSGEGVAANRTFINHKAIAIARIITKG